MCECIKLKENLELAEQEMSAMTRSIIDFENKIDSLNKELDLKELIIALRDKEIHELNRYIDPDYYVCCCVSRETCCETDDGE
jgi:septal ring factor EnvC (AmiA/AmiB activator)